VLACKTGRRFGPDGVLACIGLQNRPPFGSRRGVGLQNRPPFGVRRGVGLQNRRKEERCPADLPPLAPPCQTRLSMPIYA